MEMELHLNDLRATKILGKGATGTVFLVHSPNQQSFALKVVDKSLPSNHSHRRACHEISILRRFNSNHPFLPHLIGSFEDQHFICWAIPYCSGGDLNSLRFRQNDGVFSHAVIRFYLAEIICALEHLHEQGIVYRDLKPENILVQQSGHVTLTDFDLSRDLVRRKNDTCSDVEDYKLTHGNKKFTRFKFPKKCYVNVQEYVTTKKKMKKAKSARVSPVNRRNPNELLTNERSYSFVGTDEYVAPEVIRGDGHEFSVDWWAVGILCYEMLYGTTPFKGKNRKETFQKILFMEPEFIGKPNALTDMIGKLLEKDPTRRLGYRGGAGEVKEHEFFRCLSWDLLTEVLRPPFLPENEVSKGVGGIEIREYFEKLKMPKSPLWSPSMDERTSDVSLTEF